MDKYRFTAKMLLVAVLAGLLSGCGDDDENSESAFLRKLAGTWHIATVTLDNRDLTPLFGETTLTIHRNKTYNVEDGMPPIWPSESSFTLVPTHEPNQYKLIRDDGTEVRVQSLSTKELVLTLAYSPAPGGRLAAVSGEYVFEFERQ